LKISRLKVSGRDAELGPLEPVLRSGIAVGDRLRDLAVRTLL
jgi:hypothetical protein